MQARALDRKANKAEKMKVQKDGSMMWTEIEDLAALIRSGKVTADCDVVTKHVWYCVAPVFLHNLPWSMRISGLASDRLPAAMLHEVSMGRIQESGQCESVNCTQADWKDLDIDDVDVRLKWAGLFHRKKRTPGKFMMRLKVLLPCQLSSLMVTMPAAQDHNFGGVPSPICCSAGTADSINQYLGLMQAGTLESSAKALSGAVFSYLGLKGQHPLRRSPTAS